VTEIREKLSPAEKISNYEIERISSMLAEVAKLPPGKERTGRLVEAHVTLLWVIRQVPGSKEYDPAAHLKLDPEKQFQMMLEVFREYLVDLDGDIEGCTGDEMLDIESQVVATRRLRTRLVAHVCEGKDARGL